MQLRTYQQQYEKLKAQYAERATRVDAATKVGRVCMSTCACMSVLDQLCVSVRWQACD